MSQPRHWVCVQSVGHQSHHSTRYYPARLPIPTQGGKAEDIALYLKDGNGGVVNASRSILLAYRKVENGADKFAECSRNEAIRMRDDIRGAMNN